MNLGTIEFSAKGENLPRYVADYLQRGKHEDYWETLVPFWRSLKDGDIEVLTSELTLLEALVQPIRQNNQILISAYDSLMTKTDIKLLQINLEVLREAAKFRAIQNMKTPDAIHAATAIVAKCDYFVSNDEGFRRMENLEVVILHESI